MHRSYPLLSSRSHWGGQVQLWWQGSAVRCLLLPLSSKHWEWSKVECRALRQTLGYTSRMPWVLLVVSSAPAVQHVQVEE